VGTEVDQSVLIPVWIPDVGLRKELPIGDGRPPALWGQRDKPAGAKGSMALLHGLIEPYEMATGMPACIMGDTGLSERRRKHVEHDWVAWDRYETKPNP
jgi:hypothetical protein